MPVPTPFDTWPADKVRRKLAALDADAASINAAGQRTKEHAVNKAYYDGDHWQNGDGWIGPAPSPTDAAYSSVMAEIRRLFVTSNAVKECVDRAVGGVAARPPQFDFAPRRPMAQGEMPTANETLLIDEARSLVMEWTKQRKAAATMRSALATALSGGRAPLRVFVPEGELTDTPSGAIVEAAPLMESLMRVHFHAPDPAQAGVLTDLRTQRHAGVFAWMDDPEEDGDEGRWLELAYIDDAGRTVLKVLDADGDEAAPQSWALDLGRRLPVFQMERPPLITEAVRSNQRLLNLAKTMLARNVVTGGFRGWIFLNVNLPGRTVKDAETGADVFVPAEVEVGPGRITSLQGLPSEDAVSGAVSYAAPSVTVTDPVPVQTFTDTETDAYRAILKECHQLHYLMADDATASGVSRMAAMADYIVDLLVTKSELEAAWTWLIETALAMAAQFAGQPGRYDSIRATATAQLDAGPIAPDMMQTALALVSGGLLSTQTGMAWVGVDDPAAEAQQVTEERRQRIAEQQNAVNEAGAALADVEAAVLRRAVERRNGTPAAVGEGEGAE